jgi:hypothetical protein
VIALSASSPRSGNCRDSKSGGLGDFGEAKSLNTWKNIAAKTFWANKLTRTVNSREALQAHPFYRQFRQFRIDRIPQ